MNKLFVFIFISLFISNNTKAQGLLEGDAVHFTRQDTLRGSITKERAWWDVKHYHLDIKVNPVDSTITGSNTIKYQDGKTLKYTREGNAFFIELVAPQIVGKTKELTVFYGGKPKVAVNPPWDGGITWKKDNNGKLFIASSCQGLGASVWWPNKDHMYDEVESTLISVNVPGNLMDVSNGRLQSVKKIKDGTKTYNWYVSNPINNYGVNIKIGDYVSFSEKYQGE